MGVSSSILHDDSICLYLILNALGDFAIEYIISLGIYKYSEQSEGLRYLIVKTSPSQCSEYGVKV